MSENIELIIAGMSLVGTMFGTLVGYFTSNKLSLYRLEQLEKKFDAIGNMQEDIIILKRDIKTLFHYYDEIKRGVTRLEDDCMEK